MIEYELQLAAVHIGIHLADFDQTLEVMPESLEEIQLRVLDTFGIDLNKERNLILARDKIQAVIEQLESQTGVMQ